MDVAVSNGLPRCLAVVHADIATSYLRIQS